MPAKRSAEKLLAEIADQKVAYVLVDRSGRVASPRIFLNRETADFAANGMRMFSPVGSDEHYSAMACALVEGDVSSFLQGALGSPR